MSWRIVTVSSKSKLDYKMDYLVVRKEEQVSRIHLSEISVLLIESTAVALTAYLLCELVKRKIKVIFCDERYNPVSELCALYGSHDCSRKIREQIRWEEKIKQAVWMEIVRAKITGQALNLTEEQARERELLLSYIPNVEPGDPTNREGHAAKVYFNALFGMRFSRDNEDTVNAALDYGYSILLSAFNREIVSCGYLTELGIFHDNMFNHFNLSCDLMEPFRPFIDRQVLSMKLEKFEHEEKMKLVNVLNQTIMIGVQKQYLLAAIRIYTLSVTEALSANDIYRIVFPEYER